MKASPTSAPRTPSSQASSQAATSRSSTTRQSVPQQAQHKSQQPRHVERFEQIKNTNRPTLKNIDEVSYTPPAQSQKFNTDTSPSAGAQPTTPANSGARQNPVEPLTQLDRNNFGLRSSAGILGQGRAPAPNAFNGSQVATGPVSGAAAFSRLTQAVQEGGSAAEITANGSLGAYHTLATANALRSPEAPSSNGAPLTANSPSTNTRLPAGVPGSRGQALAAARVPAVTASPSTPRLNQSLPNAAAAGLGLVAGVSGAVSSGQSGGADPVGQGINIGFNSAIAADSGAAAIKAGGQAAQAVRPGSSAAAAAVKVAGNIGKVTGKLVPAFSTVASTYGAVQSVRQAVNNPSSENIAQAVGDTTGAALSIGSAGAATAAAITGSTAAATAAGALGAATIPLAAAVLPFAHPLELNAQQQLGVFHP